MGTTGGDDGLERGADLGESPAAEWRGVAELTQSEDNGCWAEAVSAMEGSSQ